MNFATTVFALSQAPAHELVAIVDVRHWLETPGAEIDLGTLTRDTFWFVANGQWNEYDDDRAPKPGVKLEAPRLRALPFSDLAKDR